MDQNVKIVLGLGALTDSEVQDLGFYVIKCLTGNLDFPQPTNPTLVELTASTTDFSSALAASNTRDKVSVMLKSKKRKALEVDIKAMAAYVALSNDPIKITGAGFKVAAAREVRMLGTSNGLTVQVGGNAGEAICQVSKIENASSYFIEYCISPVQNDQWIHLPAEKGKLILEKLKSLTAYDFRGGANASRGQIVHTAVITKTVL